jgi:hypothetical protein
MAMNPRTGARRSAGRMMGPGLLAAGGTDGVGRLLGAAVS